MTRSSLVIAALGVLFTSLATVLPAADQRGADGDGSTKVSGEPRVWHKVNVSLNGPFASETDSDPNPFTDLRFSVEFQHESDGISFQVPGYFAADGNAAETSAEAGTIWRAHFTPNRTGRWTYKTSFVRGKDVAVELDAAGEPMGPFHGVMGAFDIVNSDKQRPDFRAQGRLQYVSKRYLQFAGSRAWFVKAGPDSPETLLAYSDFDGTVARKRNVPLKTWQPHVQDWKPGDPEWKDGKGHGLIGAINYLSEQGINTISFLPFNRGGDGDNVWPMRERDDSLHYDCSKLDQWAILFDHAQARGLHLHFKLQETEVDNEPNVSFDRGDLGTQRKLYCREMVARFGCGLALNWNLGEENTQTTKQQQDMAAYLKAVDPYDHPIVIHTYPNQQEKVYRPLLGDRSVLTGVSLQNPWNQVHKRTLQWIRESEAAGKPWVVANDEQNPAALGIPPDEGYKGHDGWAGEGREKYNRHDIRKQTLWGNLMAGGAGVEYYFGYKLPENDLLCEDFRSRAAAWRDCRIALDFFRRYGGSLDRMHAVDELVSNEKDQPVYVLAEPNRMYWIYLHQAHPCRLNLKGLEGQFTVRWFDPRNGGELLKGNVETVSGGEEIELGMPPKDHAEDWLAVVASETDS
jgi:hypothetical protein